VTNSQLSDSAKGNLETVELMSRVARQRFTDPRIRQLALKILLEAGVKSHNFRDEAVALANFVQKYIRYVRDPHGVEQLHDPIFMLNEIMKGTAQGDCDDQALFLATLLLSIGAQPVFAIVRYNSTSGSFNHIYTVVYDKNWTTNKQRIVLDTIIKDRPIGFEVPHKSLREIPV